MQKVKSDTESLSNEITNSPYYDSNLSWDTNKGKKGTGFPTVVAAAMPVACFAILGVELCERLAYYTFTGTQEFFLEHLGYSVSEAGGLNAAMGTLCMGWAIFAGWVADSLLGRYVTIIVFGAVYAIGAYIAAVAALPHWESSQMYMFGVMVLIPLGTAGIKANISNFGADQYDTSDPAQAVAQEKFFSWFYMSINMGSAISYGYLTTLGTSGGLGLPKQYGYFAAYLIAAGFMSLALVIFCSGRTVYKIQQPKGRSAIQAVTSRLYEVASSEAPGSKSAKAVCLGFALCLAGVIMSVWQATQPQSIIAPLLRIASFLAAAAGIPLIVLPCRNPSWLTSRDEEVIASPNDYSDQDIRDYLRLLPLLFTGNLAFGPAYNSMQFWYQQQACQMDLRFFGTQLSGSFFNIADCLGIVLATPIAVGMINPYLDQRSGGRFGHGAKFGLGIALAGLSVLIAAHFEGYRKLAEVLPLVSNCAPPGITMSNMSASWMIVPFFVMGLGEIYTQPVLMHLSYAQSPKSMRTLTAATFLVIGAISTSLFTVQVAALAPFVPNDLNKGHLEYGYYSNIFLSAMLYLMFLGTLRTFEEKEF